MSPLAGEWAAVGDLGGLGYGGETSKVICLEREHANVALELLGSRLQQQYKASS